MVRIQVEGHHRAASSRRGRAVSVVLAVTAAALAVSSLPAEARPAELRPTTVQASVLKGSSDPTDVMAAKELVKDHGVAFEEALARVEQQPFLEDAAEMFAKKRPETSAGAYIDHDRGGVLVVLDTSPEEARSAVSALGSNTEVEPARWSTKELLSIANQVRLAAGINGDVTPFTTDVRSNKVSVTVDLSSDLGQRVERAVAESPERSGEKAVAVVNGTRDLKYTAECQSYYQLCDNPLRGGIGIRGSNSICTAGFNVESTSNEKLYVLTAGHCTNNTFTHYTEYENTETHVIGDSHSSYYPVGIDAGLVNIDHPEANRWNPQWWVLVRASYGTPATVADPRYDITAVGSSVPGSYLCKTGTTTGTACGAIFAVGATHPQLGFMYMGVAAIRVCAGDSGGPLYKSGRAYGITSAGDAGNYLGTYSYDTGLGTVNAACYNATWYVGAGTALATTHTKLIGT